MILSPRRDAVLYRAEARSQARKPAELNGSPKPAVGIVGALPTEAASAGVDATPHESHRRNAGSRGPHRDT